MGTFRVRELARIARSTSVEAFERLLGPLVLIGPPELDQTRGRRRFRTVDGCSSTAPLLKLLDGVAHGVRKSTGAWAGGDDAILLGRAEPNDVRIPHATVSKFHAHIRLGPDGPELLDAGSTNGTFYDGEPLPPGHKAHLEDGHRLRLGDVELDVYDPARLHSVLAGFAAEPWRRQSSG